MIWKIAKKEFLLNLMTFKFAVGTILCVVLVAVFVPVLADDYQQRLQRYSQQVTDNEARLGQVRAYRVLTPTVYRRPQVLSIFSQGLEKRLGDSAKIGFGVLPDFDTIPEINTGPAELNPYLSVFSTFDVLLIFKIVMSALALLVAYDVVSREKEQGTLSLTLSNCVARAHILLGKLVAGAITLAVPTTIAFIVGLLLLLSFPSIDLQASDWARIGVMYVASLAFVLVVYNVGLLFSCLTRSSALALVLGLFFWVLAIVVVPNGSVYLARRIQHVPDVEARNEQIELVRAQLRHEWSEKRSELPQGGGADAEEGPFGGRGHWYILVCDPAEAEYWKKGASLEMTLNSKFGRKLWEVEHAYVEGLFRQTRLARSIGRISPTCLYDNTMSALAGTDLADFQAWTSAARTYRDSLIAYIRNKTDDLRSASYVTQSTEAEQAAWAKGGEFRKDAVQAAGKHTLPLNLEDLPRFTCSTGILQGIQRAAPDLLLLVVFNLVFYSLSFVAFQKYDVR
jgi:ABC-type transport system involved in multi-copper enzyme maturation permease subunit